VNTAAEMVFSTPEITGGNVVRAAAHVAQGALLLERARRESLSGRNCRLYSELAERLREMGKAIERVGRAAQ
jgi:predicted fused transcriptional regulator/phosphomethylpyrimidine kinase